MITLLMLGSPALALDGEALKRAGELPKLAQSLRDEGVPELDVRDAVRAGKESKLPPEETTEVLKGVEEDVKEHGPVDNFGAFVQSKLKEGLRGKDLAAAIHAEHEARGKGKGKGKPEGKGKPDDKGGKPDDKGKPEGKGQSEGKGKPDNKPTTGKPSPGKGGAPGRIQRGSKSKGKR